MVTWPEVLVMVLTIGVTFSSSAEGSPCPYKNNKCYCFPGTMVCEHLQALPPLQPNSDHMNITDVTFSDGNITTIASNSLPPNLVTVTFTKHPLTNIAADAFKKSSKTLKYLTISEAKFNRLPAAFATLDNLNQFNLDHIYIQDWDTATFENSKTSLTNLVLVSVGLTEWPDWFSLFRSLQVVDFSNNFLQSVPDNAFDFLNDTLLHLTLRFCNLTKVPTALSTISKLTSLDLSGNVLTKISNAPAIGQIGKFPLAKTLVILQVQYSGLKVIPNFANLTKLLRVNLDYNQIIDPKSGAFSQSVSILELGNNNLPSVPTVVAKMSGLSYLDLSHNNLQTVNFDAFPLTLDTVDLSFNHINEIENSTTNGLSQLTTLHLTQNPITTIPLSVLEHLTKLQTLYLEDTQLTTIPVGLPLLNQMQTLSLRRVSSLSCPCPPPTELVTWYAGLKNKLKNIGFCSSGDQVSDYFSGKCSQNVLHAS